MRRKLCSSDTKLILTFLRSSRRLPLSVSSKKPLRRRNWSIRLSSKTSVSSKSSVRSWQSSSSKRRKNLRPLKMSLETRK